MTNTASALPTGRRIAGGTLLLLIVRVAGLCMGLVVSVVLAHELGAAALGTFATGLALAQIGSTFTDFGLGALLIREASAAPELRVAMLQWATRARIASGIAVFAILVAITPIVVRGGEARTSVILVLLTVPLSALTLGMTMLEQRLMLAPIAALLVVQSVLWLAVVAALAIAHAHLLAYAVGYLVFNLGYALLVRAVSRRALTGPAETMTLRHFARLMRDVVPLSATVVLVTLYYKLDSLFVYRIAGAAAAGNYAVAYRFLDQLAIVPITLGNVFPPLLNRRRSAGDSTQALFQRYIRFTLLLSMPVAIGGLIMSRPLVGLFGADYDEAVLLLRLLLPVFVVISLSYVVVHMAVVHRHAKKQLAAACLGLFVNVLLNLLFVPRYGARAAAVVTLVTESAVVALLYASLRKPCGLALKWRWLARLTLALGVSSVGPVLVRDKPLLGALVFGCCYLASIKLLQLVEPDEIGALLRRSTAPQPIPEQYAAAVDAVRALVPDVPATEL